MYLVDLIIDYRNSSRYDMTTVQVDCRSIDDIVHRVLTVMLKIYPNADIDITDIVRTRIPHRWCIYEITDDIKIVERKTYQ